MKSTKARVLISVFTVFLSLVIVGFTFATYKNGSFSEHIQLDGCAEINLESVLNDNNVTNAETHSEYNSFLEAYYRGLTSNYGMNYKSSCGYVAIGMLLSYYDTYLSDSIIQGAYDKVSEDNETNMIIRNNSPGILLDYDVSKECAEFNKASGFDLSATEYYQAIERMSNDPTQPSLHAKLISIGNSLGYYDYKDDQNACATNFTQVNGVLKSYLKNTINLNENTDYEIKTQTGSKSAIKNFIKSNIEQGRPVIVSAYLTGAALGHVFIAYDFEGDNIYCHLGTPGYPTYINVESRYDTYRYAIAVDFKMPHTHTKNYVVVNADGSRDYYCWDNCDIITYKQKEHNYTDHYDIELSEHTAYCACGASKVELHNYIDHYEKADSEYHYVYCECGEKIDEKHYWLNDPDYSGIGSAVRCKYCLFSKRLKPGEFIPIIIGRHDDEFEES